MQRVLSGSLILIFATLGCANHSQKVTEDPPRKSFVEEQDSIAISNEAAKEVDASYFVEIAFAPGSSHLTESSQTAIENLMNQAKQGGSLAEVKILAWADNELPSAQRKTLSESQRRLADRRAKVVESYVKRFTKVDIDRHNMAMQPNVVAKWFDSSDARLKRTLVAAGLPTTADDPQYPSKASHSLIMVQLQEDVPVPLTPTESPPPTE